jgi:hypothetical protein
MKKLKTFLFACSAFLLSSASMFAQIDLTTGGSGGFTGVGQSFNESRGIDVTVLSTVGIQITSMTLNQFNVSFDGMAVVGARIYNSATSALLYSHDTTVYNIYYGPVSMPVSFLLVPGQSYRIGFYCSGTNSDNSAIMFQPTVFPYIESTNVLRINHAYSLLADAFPSGVNIFVPMVSLTYDSVSVTNILSANETDPGIGLFPNPADGFLRLTGNLTNLTRDVEILDTHGRIVLRQKDAQVTHDKINVSSLAAGVYFVRVKMNERYSMLKFVKE